jgi:heavy metal sensor kinase
MRTVSGRLALLTTALCALALGAFASSLYLWVREGQRRALEAQADLQLRVFQEQFIEEYEEHRRGVHPEIAPVLDILLDATGAVAKVAHADGRPVYASDDWARFEALFPRTSSFRVSSGEEFVLQLGVPFTPVDQPLQQLRAYFAIFLPLVLLLAGALAWFGARRALAPLDDIRRQAERISRQNVSERIPLGPLYGELFTLARTFNDMLDRLDRAIQDLQSFAADAAHELRTPLANLRAEVETAAQGARSREEHEDILASVSEEVFRMSHIVTDLLTLARMDLRQHALKRETVRLRPLLEDARETWQALAAERGIAIEVSGEDVEVPGDPEALRRVFMNLLHNAVKYNREGGRVELGLETAGGRVLVRVRDTGIGIPAEHLPNLFRRFFRVDAARSRDSGGAGLGLAICKSFVEAHEGTLTVSSEAERGTTFVVELPTLPRPVLTI